MLWCVPAWETGAWSCGPRLDGGDGGRFSIEVQVVVLLADGVLLIVSCQPDVRGGSSYTVEAPAGEEA